VIRVLDDETTKRLQAMSNLDLIKEMGKRIKECDEFLDYCKMLIMKSPEFEEIAKQHGKELKLHFSLKS